MICNLLYTAFMLILSKAQTIFFLAIFPIPTMVVSTVPVSLAVK